MEVSGIVGGVGTSVWALVLVLVLVLAFVLVVGVAGAGAGEGEGVTVGVAGVTTGVTTAAGCNASVIA